MIIPPVPRSGGTHKIVCLDAVLCPVPKFDFPHEYIEYANTIGEELIISRIADATIVITTRAWVSARTVAQSPRLELVALMAVGYDIVDVAACRARRVTVCNSPAASAESVAEHAFALYFAVKRRVIELHRMVLEGEEWPRMKNGFHRFPHMPRVARNEMLGIVGYGALGIRIEGIAKALGMKVIIAERKGLSKEATRPGRTQFDEVLQICTALMIGCPLDAETRGMIGERELQQMRPDSLVVNVARGGVMDEAALVRALNEGWIASAATDVFATEPATLGSTPLIDKCPANLTLSPHVAWYADSSLESLQMLIKGTVESYVAGSPQNMVKESWSIYEESKVEATKDQKEPRHEVVEMLVEA
ncbi:hypothetical protein GGR54DRAFT_647992 [Hypoxylon sp. NC1633]|nr:hypothetical protein GGR54DRAFT_647992 [Hypoxylon sp. NC1633]